MLNAFAALYSIGGLFGGITSAAVRRVLFLCRHIPGKKSATGPNRRNRWLTGLESRASAAGLPAAGGTAGLGARNQSARAALSAGSCDPRRGCVSRSGLRRDGDGCRSRSIWNGRTPIDDVRFDRALFCQEGEYVKAQISINDADASFEIHSRAEHALGSQRGGTAGAGKRADPRSVSNGSGIRCSACWRPQSAIALRGPGLPLWSGISKNLRGLHSATAKLWRGLRSGRRQVRVPSSSGGSGWCFQVLVATDPLRARGGPAKTYLPVGIDGIRVRKRPEGSMWAWARLDRRESFGRERYYFAVRCRGRGAFASSKDSK